MKLHWLIPGTFLTVSLLSSPADAAKLESWDFDAKQNQLEFNTDSAVQPTAQLIFNPTRVVIDLPGVKFGSPQLKKPIGGAVKTVRIGQFDPETTRMVVELNPGYTLDPNQIKFEGVSPSRWRVQLPSPELEKTDDQRSIYSVVSTSNTAPSNTSNSNQTVIQTAKGTTQIERVLPTGDGFFVRTSGGKANSVRINRDGQEFINVDVSGATLSSGLPRNEFPMNRFGVKGIEFKQLDSTTARIVLRVNKNSPDWQAKISSISSGVVLLPNGSVSQLPTNNNSSSPVRPLPPSPPPTIATRNSFAEIESVELDDNGRSLTVRANKSLSGSTSEWDSKSAMYRILIPNARLTSSVQGPKFKPNSSVLRVQMRQQDSNTVAIYILPAAQVSFGRLDVRGNQLNLDLQRNSAVRPPVMLPPIPRPNPVAGSQPVTTPPKANPSPAPRPAPRGQVLVMIDPGHGGKDPGAIGIGGLQEKDIILPIGQKVAEILRKNGVSAVLTRNSDFFVSLQGRVDMSDKANADLFVSIHANSLGLSRPDVSGLEVYYYNTGKQLADTVRRSIIQNVTIKDRGIRQARFYVLRKSSMPSILVETGYVTGREDAANLKQAAYRNKMAEGIADGILKYLKRR
ncbi:N-acetylmuramoyl-L-alanine amidase [Rivularia sp. UHCC 0363]|uniref:N-acetylmuramoyl-L-alanine amidase n=1 Tax=Rivularia sp. UHCC 0363 TaxID=3110244 RepID=UPI002B208853|nr:N-acetylmuramoyl-L-alanine amidase [Rivularia sp. UHCC 0363]MEA5598222.1 N-acetylmuramoyl-L-alanine amidase [Rivularia sp. UHCC 0363]